MKMPPLLADFIHAGACIPICEKFLTRPLRQLIERVNIGRNFEIEVEFKISVTQFFDFLHPEGDKSVYYRAS